MIQNNSRNIFYDPRLQVIFLTTALFILFLFSFTILKPYIEVIGSKVGSNNPIMDFQFNLVFYWFIGFFLIFLPFNFKTRSVLVYAYIFRFIFLNTVSIYYLFTYSTDKGPMVTSLDEMFFFNQAFLLSSNEIGFVGSGLISRFNLIIAFFLPKNYFLFRAIFGFFSFLGLILIWKGISEYFSKNLHGLLVLILFFPSVLFWSINMGKEPLILFGLGLYFIGHIRMLKSYKFSNLALLSLGLLIVTAVRPWMILILSPGIGLLFLLDEKVKTFYKVASLVTLFLVFPYALNFVISGVIRGDDPLGGSLFYGIGDLFRIINSFIASGATTEATNNPLVFDAAVAKVSSFYQLFNPLRIFSALFRPLPMEAGGLIGIVVGFENIILLSIAIFTLINLTRTRFKLEKIEVLLIIHILVWACLYGAILDFNWGYLFRQKVIILPFLLSLFYLFNKRINLKNK